MSFSIKNSSKIIVGDISKNIKKTNEKDEVFVLN
jgi:hypothetical protein